MNDICVQGVCQGSRKKNPTKKYLPYHPLLPLLSITHFFLSVFQSFPSSFIFCCFTVVPPPFFPPFHCLLFSLLFIWAFRGWISFSQWYLTALTTTSRVHHSGRTEQRCLNAFLEHCWGAVGDGREVTEPPPTSYKIFIYFSLFEHSYLFITLY